MSRSAAAPGSSPARSSPTCGSRPTRSSRGSTIPLIVGFAGIIAVAIATVVDASAAYLRHQDLAALADGAALRGADLGAEGREVYEGGLGEGRLGQTSEVAGRAVETYLDQVGARLRFPGLRAEVTVDGTRVVVHLRAPADLPLAFPGAPRDATVGAVGAAAVALLSP